MSDLYITDSSTRGVHITSHCEIQEGGQASILDKSGMNVINIWLLGCYIKHITENSLLFGPAPLIFTSVQLFSLNWKLSISWVSFYMQTSQLAVAKGIHDFIHIDKLIIVLKNHVTVLKSSTEVKHSSIRNHKTISSTMPKVNMGSYDSLWVSQSAQLFLNINKSEIAHKCQNISMNVARCT